MIIALPLFLHARVAIAAMKRGLHVLTEKLMGQTVAQCKEMARVAKETKLLLATGHQRHYSILYDNAVELVRNRLLGDVHYIAAQWHRGNLPGKDSWQMPLPTLKPGSLDAELHDLLARRDGLAKQLHELAAKGDEAGVKKNAADTKVLDLRIKLKEAQIADKIVEAEKYGYEAKQWKYIDDKGKEVAYDRSAIEELIRWRLWDRTGGGMMAELGSHQLDAASIFISAMHGPDKHVHPLSVSASATRPIFPKDRDIEDHVFCVFEFPHPDYNPKDPAGKDKKIGVQYSSINGNGFGGYGETIYGTEGTLVLEREQEAMLFKIAATDKKTKVGEKERKIGEKKIGEKGGKETVASLSIDETGKGDEESAAIGHMAITLGRRPATGTWNAATAKRSSTGHGASATRLRRIFPSAILAWRWATR